MILGLFHLRWSMRTFFPSESCTPKRLNSINLQPWRQAERGTSSEFASKSPSSLESLIKVRKPPIVPFFKPIDYVEILAQIHKELESCPPQERSKLYLLQYQVFKGLGEVKLMQRSIRAAWLEASNVYEKLVFGAWLKYERQGAEIISELLPSCGKCAKEFGIIDVASELHAKKSPSFGGNDISNDNPISKNVSFQIGDEKVVCDRLKIAGLSIPFRAMLYGCFVESSFEDIDLSENNISPSGMRLISDFSITGSLTESPFSLLLEILVFANKFCCENLKDACDRKLASLVSFRQDAVELMEYALQENAPVLAASCLQVFLHDLPDSLNDSQVFELLSSPHRQHRTTMVGPALFSFYSLLSEVAIKADPSSDKAIHFSKKLVDCAETRHQKMMAYHQFACVRLLRKEYNEAEHLFEAAFDEGHVYSVVGLARLSHIKGDKDWSYKRLSSIISSYSATGWMYQERSLYYGGTKKCRDLEKATELDPTLTYPYMFRAASLIRRNDVQGALAEINRVLGFKIALECLELRFCFYLALEDYQFAMRDVQAILTLKPDYQMLDGRVAASKLCILLREHVENWTTADCWLQLYERWSSVDDIGSLSVIYQMLESDAAKSVLYFRQSLLLLRLNCSEAAMRSLQLARQNASSEHERLVYEGWILYDTGHCEEALRKAEESIILQRSFEAFFLKAFALADSTQDPSCSSTVISLLEEALKCPSDRLRKGQALNNLGSVYVDCGKLDAAADCYINAIKIWHSRAHQGLARVHSLRNDKNAACAEMTELIERAPHCASAYEKRSEYCERELIKADLGMVTHLDPFRVYPYRYRAAVLMDNNKAEEAIAELSRAISFKADLHLLHLRAAFHEHIGDVMGALRDCRAALSLDPNHQEMLELHGRVNSQEP